MLTSQDNARCYNKQVLKCKGSQTVGVYFLPIKCPELFEANGEWEEGMFLVILGPRLMEAL